MLTGENQQKIVVLLVNCWGNLSGSDAQSTSAEKLYRAEELAWTPPLLSFQLERHGGAVLGSTRASVHHWSVDVEKGTAAIVRETPRQLRPTAPRVSFSLPIAKVCELIINHGSNDFIEWKSPDGSLLKIGEIVSGSNAQTVASRRKRFRKELQGALAPHGWQVKLNGSRTVIERIGQQ